ALLRDRDTRLHARAPAAGGEPRADRGRLGDEPAGGAELHDLLLLDARRVRARGGGRPLPAPAAGRLRDRRHPRESGGGGSPRHRALPYKIIAYSGSAFVFGLVGGVYAYWF